MPRRSWKRKVWGSQNRGAVFVDLDNLRLTLATYRNAGAPLITLSQILDWLEERDNLGLTEVRKVYVFGTYANAVRPAGDETLLERRHLSKQVVMVNHPMPPPGTPGYEDEVIREQMHTSRQAWDTAVVVTSDWKAFAWADEVHGDDTPAGYGRKDVVVVHSHLDTSRSFAQDARNAVSLEEMFPVLNTVFSGLRGYNPLKVPA